MKLRCEGIMDGIVDLNLNFKLKEKKIIKCFTAPVGKANKKYGRIYTPIEFVGCKAIILVEEK